MKAMGTIRNRNVLIILLIFFTAALLTLLAQTIVPPEKEKIHGEFLIDRGYEDMPEYAEGEVLVKFKRGVSLAEVHHFAASHSTTVKKHFKTISRIKGHEYVLLKSETKTAPRMLQSMRKEPEVDFAAPNYRVHTCDNLPNDPRFDELWGLHNTGQTGGIVDVDIDAPEAWERIGRTSSVIVAVIDTGINYNHPDLAANMWVNPGEIAGNGKDDDGNGYTDDIHGINAITESGDPMDDNGHGTHCAGTIGAVGNNGLDGCGVCRDIKIIGAKALDATGSGFNKHTIACLEYIINLKTTYNQNIVAINASYGGEGYDPVKDAIDAAGEVGIIFCASAGNDHTDNDTTPFYPASYTSHNIIAVTAVDHEGKQWYNYGVTSVDLAAPGFDILSTKSWYSPQAGDIFYDDMESGDGLWSHGGKLDSWEITTNQEKFAHPNYPIPSPYHFWSDKPGYDYAPNTDSWLMNNEDIDISAYKGQDLYIGFGSAMAIQKTFDHAYVEVSGSSGTHWRWPSLMDFSGYGARWRTGYYYLIPDTVKTEHFRFRFHLTSDGQTEVWGWLIDDVGIGTTIVHGCELQCGTSMAAPYVTGAVAFIAAVYPLDSVSRRVARILDNVTPLDSLSGKCATGGLLNLDLAVGQPPHITVTDPLEGETFSIGKEISINWISWGITGDVKITLEGSALTDNYPVSSGTAYDSFPYHYTIPCYVPAGTYFVRVAKQGIGDGKSGNFKINTGKCITVSEPSGGEIVYPGDQVSIEWDTWGIAGDVQIILYRSDSPKTNYLVTGAVPYDGSPFSYTIPIGMTAGSHYFGVKKKDEAFGKSAKFTIKPGIPSITVIKPAAGETFNAGKQIVIEWITSGITGNVMIILKRSDGSGNYTINPAIPHNNLTYSYRLPASIPSGTYVIEIRQGNVYGMSGNFTIN